MSNRSIAILAVIAAIVVLLSVITFRNNQIRAEFNNMKSYMESMGSIDPNTDNDIRGYNYTYVPLSTHDYSKNIVKPREGQPIKKFSLTAQEAKLEIAEGLWIPVWTYNGTVPGQEIRVTQGDFVQVELKNNLKEPVTIHWHGYPLKSAMDGVPGLNQDAVRPGETFTYEFSAEVVGTYWYHSHQEGAKQVDKGLYGALIVEPKGTKIADRDYTIILDEWMSVPMEEDMGSMEGMKSYGKSGSYDLVEEEEEMMATAYDIYTINGKSGKLIQALGAKVGEIVRLRFINAGYRSHGIHIPGQDIRVVSTDGQDISGAGVVRDQIVMIAPGERYDIEFTVTSEDDFEIDFHDNNIYNQQIKVPVNIIDGNKKLRGEVQASELKEFDLTIYGTLSIAQFDMGQIYDVSYDVELGTKTSNGLQYTINEKVYTELPPIKVKTGDRVKLTYFNNSIVNHPMHLHGHFFQLLSRNGVAITGAPIIKDTLMIKPGEKYEVAFLADNAGDWVQHCHELHHAAAGMMQAVEYSDFKSNYTPDPQNTFNKPE